MWVLWTYSRQACRLVGTVALLSTSLWACRYIVRRNELYSSFLGKIEFSKKKKMVISSRAVAYWTDDAVQQCFSVLVRRYDVLKTGKKNRNPVLLAVKTHVAAPASTTLKHLQQNQFEKRCPLFVRARDPSGRPWCRVG